jgi:hypothetical protein
VVLPVVVAAGLVLRELMLAPVTMVAPVVMDLLPPLREHLFIELVEVVVGRKTLVLPHPAVLAGAATEAVGLFLVPLVQSTLVAVEEVPGIMVLQNTLEVLVLLFLSIKTYTL